VKAPGGAAVGPHGPSRLPLDFGQTLLLPASVGPCAVEPQGEAVVLTCVVP